MLWLAQVGELVDDHVVDHPVREAGEARGEADGPGLRGAAPPAGAHAVTQRIELGAGRSYRRARVSAARPGRSMRSVATLRSNLRVHSATQRASSAVDIHAGKRTSSVVPTSRAEDVRVRLALRITWTSKDGRARPGEGGRGASVHRFRGRSHARAGGAGWLPRWASAQAGSHQGAVVNVASSSGRRGSGGGR